MANDDRVILDLSQPEFSIDVNPNPVIQYKGSLQKLRSERKYKVDFATDLRWFHKNVPCREACPVGTNARAYVVAIAEGDYQKAYLIARENNPFVSVCGKICSAPCEPACTRGKLDEPVSIRALKGFAAEKNSLSTREVYGWIRKRVRKITLPAGKNVPKVAIVGAGPAGLAAAHDLALMGYRVRLLESASQPGGILTSTIPSFKLAREVVKRDIEDILSLGIELETNVSYGKDYSIRELREKYDAVVLAIESQKNKAIDIPGVRLGGVHSGMDFLMEVALKGTASVGTKIVVIGGGSLAVAVARTARRISGTKGTKVTVVCYEVAKGAKKEKPLPEMTAEGNEIAEAVQEGIAFYPGLGPKQILGEGGKVVGVELAPVEDLSFDNKGGYKPVFKQNGSSIIEANTVLLAVGQEPDWSSFQGEENTLKRIGELEGKGPFANLMDGVFLCGDLSGTGNVIEAIASGQKGAFTIHKHLGGEGSLGLGEPRPLVPVHHHEKSDTFANRLSIGRVLPPIVPAKVRQDSMEPVEGSYSEKVARRQAERCLNCIVSPMVGPYNPCNACGDCIDVCPTECIHLRFINKKDLSSGDGPIEEAYGEGPWVGLMIDEEKCVHCGACAEACWADAIYMVKFEEEVG